MMSIPAFFKNYRVIYHTDMQDNKVCDLQVTIPFVVDTIRILTSQIHPYTCDTELSLGKVYPSIQD